LKHQNEWTIGGVLYSIHRAQEDTGHRAKYGNPSFVWLSCSLYAFVATLISGLGWIWKGVLLLVWTAAIFVMVPSRLRQRDKELMVAKQKGIANINGALYQRCGYKASLEERGDGVLFVRMEAVI